MPPINRGFSQRLHVALDMAGVKKGRGRITQLADLFDVSRETARKQGCTNVLTIISKAATNAYKYTMN